MHSALRREFVGPRRAARAITAALVSDRSPVSYFAASFRHIFAPEGRIEPELLSERRARSGRSSWAVAAGARGFPEQIEKKITHLVLLWVTGKNIIFPRVYYPVWGCFWSIGYR